jgi:hypothetical protein
MSPWHDAEQQHPLVVVPTIKQDCKHNMCDSKSIHGTHSDLCLHEFALQWVCSFQWATDSWQCFLSLHEALQCICCCYKPFTDCLQH